MRTHAGGVAQAGRYDRFPVRVFGSQGLCGLVAGLTGDL